MPLARSDAILVPGRNCWRIERAHRVAFFVDAADYFAALRSAIVQAQCCIFVLGWDFDSRIPLVPQGANDGYPDAIGPLLRAVARERRKLHVYVLSWDFVFVYAGNRQWVPLYKLGWKTHPGPRVSFRLDGTTPVTGSHHQKVVVVDDATAFVGGIDLTHGRWDTPAHRAGEPYRIDIRGRPARPNHDVQAIVDGDAAKALGALCRDRWQRATRQTIDPVSGARTFDPWPAGLAPAITDVPVAIARTDPGYRTHPPLGEIRHLYVDAIRKATRALYLENHTSARASLAMRSPTAWGHRTRRRSWSSRGSPRKTGSSRTRWVRCARACTGGSSAWHPRIVIDCSIHACPDSRTTPSSTCTARC
jgi:phosphatidylserine/phosphatidylglycerophosphate/cardiolipin synthase-like enzyme